MWLMIFLVVPLIGMAYPGFVSFLNWGVLFPIAVLAVGSIAWAMFGLLGGIDLGWSTCLLLIGLPAGIWITRTSLG